MPQTDGDPPRDFSRREDGSEYHSKVTETHPCEWCGTEVPQRAEGRYRRFCSPRCRVRWNRKYPKLF